MTTFYKKMKLYKGRLKLLKLKNGYLFFFWKSCRDVVQWYQKINILTYKCISSMILFVDNDGL